MKLIPDQMFINSFCSITPGGILSPGSQTAAFSPLKAPRVAVNEPDYKDLIPPMQLRRMTKPIRIGVAAAKLCMQSGSNFMPASIHVGTAFGMLEDSENFLRKMLEQQEQLLNPTAFIQSTHNTVSGQIALAIGCTAHNMTFVHKAHSFENALLDASLLLDEVKDDENILAGAVEELTDTSYEILKRFGVYKAHDIAGEGAAFFGITGNRQDASIAKIESIEMFRATHNAGLHSLLDAFWSKNNVTGDDLIIDGSSSNATGPAPIISYREYCGKYATMSAFGLAWACLKLKESGKERCFILNGSGEHYSIILISKP